MGTAWQEASKVLCPDVWTARKRSHTWPHGSRTFLYRDRRSAPRRHGVQTIRIRLEAILACDMACHPNNHLLIIEFFFKSNRRVHGMDRYDAAVGFTISAKFPNFRLFRRQPKEMAFVQKKLFSLNGKG